MPLGSTGLMLGGGSIIDEWLWCVVGYFVWG